MGTSTRSRRPLQPATGTVRWVSDDPANSLRLGASAALTTATQTRDGLRVTGYVRRALLEGGRLVGYELRKAEQPATAAGDPNPVYHIDVTGPHGWTCDCPDATFRPERPGGCRHVAALRAALHRINLL
jgi:hypothetical protein